MLKFDSSLQFPISVKINNSALFINLNQKSLNYLNTNSTVNQIYQSKTLNSLIRFQTLSSFNSISNSHLNSNLKYYAINNSLHLNVNQLLCYIVSFSSGFFTELTLVGLGFRASKKIISNLNFISFELHFSHKLFYKIPSSVLIKCNKKRILVFGLQRAQVLNVANEIKSLRYPNIYKGKGIRFLGEVIKLKPGKQR